MVNSDNMKITLLKSNYGSISSEESVAREIEQTLNGSFLTMTNNQMIIETHSDRFFLTLEKYDDHDPLHDTFITNLFGKVIRIVRPSEHFRDMLGDNITFASGYSNGFAIHFNIE